MGKAKPLELKTPTATPDDMVEMKKRMEALEAENKMHRDLQAQQEANKDIVGARQEPAGAEGGDVNDNRILPNVRSTNLKVTMKNDRGDILINRGEGTTVRRF